MDEAADASAHTGEIVFVLRLRLGASGWWGQVQRLDPTGPTSLRWVGGTQELYDLFAQEGRAILAVRAAGTPARQPGALDPTVDGGDSVAMGRARAPDRDYQIAKGGQSDGEDAT